MESRQFILNTLLSIRPQLSERFAVSTIGLFGSVLRDDYTANSVDFSRPVGIEFIDLAEFLESKFHRRVDLVSKNGINSKFFDLIKSEIQYV
jgi:predicted nucleotidyltransferase